MFWKSLEEIMMANLEPGIKGKPKIIIANILRELTMSQGLI